jgi:hypothetical protein
MPMPIFHRPRTKLLEIKRVLRVWNTIRKWFHDADAADADDAPLND